MKEKIIPFFKGYFIYFVFMFIISFSATYFIFVPLINEIMGINENDFYIRLKKEKMDIKNQDIKNVLKEKISSYELRLDELKVKIDKELEYKKTVLKNGLKYTNESELCLHFKEFIKNSFILEKYQLSEKYSKMMQQELIQCK